MQVDVGEMGAAYRGLADRSGGSGALAEADTCNHTPRAGSTAERATVLPPASISQGRAINTCRVVNDRSTREALVAVGEMWAGPRGLADRSGGSGALDVADTCGHLPRAGSTAEGVTVPPPASISRGDVAATCTGGRPRRREAHVHPGGDLKHAERP